MKSRNSHGLLCLLLAMSTGMAFSQTSSAAIIEHTPDANTLLLYHFNETTPDQYAGGADFGDSNYSGSPGPFNGFGFDIASDQIVMGQNSVPGLDKAIQLRGPSATPAAKRNSVTAGDGFGAGNYWNGGSMTIEAWIMNPLLAGGDSTTGRLIAISRETAISFSFGLTSTGAMKTFGNVTDSSFNISTSGLTWNLNTWYYVALVVDTTGQDAGMAEFSFYRAAYGDTSLTLLHSTTGLAPGDANSGLSIGGETTANSRSFQGYIDEVQFSNIARSADYLATYAIPEPSAIALGAIGIGLILLRVRRSQRR